MKQIIALTLCLVIFALVSESVRSEILASSGSPMAGANPSRNHQINKKLLCPDVAPDRTQVWSIAWKSQLPTNFQGDYSDGIDLTQDEQGFVYLQCAIDGDTKPKILKINGTDGSYDINLAYSAPFALSGAVPTHVQGNKMYIAATEMTTIVNTTSMTDIAVLPHASYASSYIVGSYSPFNKDLMVTSYPSTIAVNILRYLNTTLVQFDSTQLNFASAFANDVIVYKNRSGVDNPIVVLAKPGSYGTITVWSPNYQVTLPGSNLYDYSYVQNNQLVVQYYSYPQSAFTVALLDPETGALIRNFTSNTFNVQSSTLLMFGNKSIGSGSINGSVNIVDFVNEKVIIEDRQSRFKPLYSIPDNSVLIAILEPVSTFPGLTLELTSLDWDTDVINAVGSFPNQAYFGDVSVSPPIIGEDCMLYQYLNDNGLYLRTLFAFKPLPVSDIVPILECINADGVGYFSYNNREDKDIVIPYVSDRNNLEPMNIAPAREFKAHRRGRYFPLSSRVTLDNSTSSFTWKLEDYVLSFTNTPQLRCPSPNVIIIIYFNATSVVPSGFDEWTRQTFASLNVIADSRVTVVASSSQGSVPFDFKVALQITPSLNTSSQEATPELAAWQFAEARFYLFQIQLAANKTYSPSNITIVDIDGAGPLATEISGTIPSPQPLTQAPIGQPISQPQPNNQSPTSQPQQNNDTPKSHVVSTGSLSSNSIIAVITVLLWAYL